MWFISRCHFDRREKSFEMFGAKDVAKEDFSLTLEMTH